MEEDEGIDYLVHHPGWDAAETLAQDDGHFMGPGLSWADLTAIADNGLPGGSTTNPPLPTAAPATGIRRRRRTG
ncbi:hypothetical protein [Streptomyces sp. NPDC001717]|uniref:hypothetical protein n=1 Tax=Streptomyces sp. NPDC001717 TaxID=3364604 RepID=UPI003692FF9D